jgi:hypothetical protein
MSERDPKCIWNCGRQTKNKTRICDECWAAAEPLRENSEEGYRAWLERKQAKATSEARKAHLEKARAARVPKRLIDLSASETSRGS